MERTIIGFDQDELGDWRAILDCGHRQHVRHNPPLVNRPWVLTAEGRSRFLGVALACKACDEGEPVSEAMIAPDALEAVYAQFQADLIHFIRRHIADADTAETILQNVIYRIHAQANTLREGDRLAEWLDRIVREAMGNRHHPLPEADDCDATTLLADAIRGMLACLPGAYRQALILTEHQGLQPSEMAARLDISAAEAEARVRRGWEMVGEALVDWCHWAFERVGRALPYQGGCAVRADVIH